MRKIRRPVKTIRRKGPFKRRVCHFCKERIDIPDYKEVSALRRYVSDRGKIIPARSTGTCAYHQRKLTIAIKRARNLALLPFTTI